MTVLAIARQRISAREAARLMKERATRDARFRALVQNSSDVVIVLDASLRANVREPRHRRRAWGSRRKIVWSARSSI